MILLGFLMAGCSTENQHKIPPGEQADGCGHNQNLPRLKLDETDKAILAARKDPPKTAADYYFALPPSYFSIVENSSKRRATFIEKSSLSNTYLHAKHFFECDGGGFEVTIRVFDSSSGPLIAILALIDEPVEIMSKKNPAPGELESISLSRPRFWRYAKGAWHRVDDSILPQPTKQFVISRYRYRYKAHLKYTGNTKSIFLQYELPASGNNVRVWGRENFMDSAPTWKTYHFNGSRFVPCDGK